MADEIKFAFTCLHYEITLFHMYNIGVKKSCLMKLMIFYWFDPLKRDCLLLFSPRTADTSTTVLQQATKQHACVEYPSWGCINWISACCPISVDTKHRDYSKKLLRKQHYKNISEELQAVFPAWKDLMQVIQINSRDLFHALQMLFHFHIIAEMQNTCLMCGMRNQFSLWDITRAHTSFTEGYLGIITTLPSWWLFIVYIMPFGKKECCSGYNLMSIKIIHHPWPS